VWAAYLCNKCTHNTCANHPGFWGRVECFGIFLLSSFQSQTPRGLSESDVREWEKKDPPRPRDVCWCDNRSLATGPFSYHYHQYVWTDLFISVFCTRVVSHITSNWSLHRNDLAGEVLTVKTATRKRTLIASQKQREKRLTHLHHELC
jgi:hypothetical protein